jgi:hypothetical protein
VPRTAPLFVKTSAAERLRVADHGPVDDIGKASFQAAHGFFVGLARGSFPLVVVPARGRSFDLGHGHDMQRVVELPVAGPRQAMPLDVTGRHFYRRDTAIRGERGLRPEPADRAGTGQDLRGDHIADAVRIGQGGAGRRDRRGQRRRCLRDAPIKAAHPR